MKKLILIDGNALVHRAFHAIPALTSANGVVTNAVYGFTSILLKTIRDLKPDYIAATFDLAGPTFRHEQFEEYKAQRVKAPDELYKQIPIVKEVLAVFGIPVYEMQGYEADDLIGTLAMLSKKEKDLQCVIATGDLDTLQLVDGKKVVVFTLRKGMADTVIYDEDAVFARYGLKPEQLNDYRGLKGDPSDNIPGVPGIGEKTAADLIQKFGSLDGLYKYLETANSQEPIDNSKKKNKKSYSPLAISDKLAQKLLANKENAYFSKQLSEIITDLDIDFSLEKTDWRNHAERTKIEKIFKDLSFFSLVKRLDEIGLSAQTLPNFPTGAEGAKQIKSENLGGQMGGQKSLDFDSASAKMDEKDIFFVEDETDKITEKILKDAGRTLIGHDLKNILKPFITDGAEIKCRLFDTKIAAYLLNPDLRDYDFHKIYYFEFKEEAEDLARKSAYLARLKKELWEKIQKLRLEEVFETMEMPLIKVLAEMELNGIKVDVPAIAELQKITNKEIAKLETRIYKIAGADFNISSPQQLAEVLYDKLKIIPPAGGRIKKTGGGKLSTAAPQLEKLRDNHPIIDLILQYRELTKLKTTYIEPFPQLIDPKDGRIHTTYNQCGTTTGRLSSEDPNLQNIPIKTELGQEFRKAFIAERGYQLVSFDYSQLDLRVVAHIAKDEKMIEAFKRGDDIHTRTAVEIFEVAPDKVTKEMRRQAKVMNFGLIYGMGAGGFSQASGVDRQRAREFITKYFAEFRGVAEYMEEIKNKAHRDGYVETIFGRRRQLLDIFSTMPQIQAAAERAAINHPVQGTAADLMKLTMIKVHDYFCREFYQKSDRNSGRMLLQVHDELVCEIRSDLVQKISRDIKEIMESVHELKVPLVVAVKAGENWQEQKIL